MLVACKRCGRHIRVDDACPFCRAGTTFAAAALSAGVLLSGCDKGTPTTHQGSAATAGAAATAGSAVGVQRDATIRGVVKDRGGTPVAGADVSLSTKHDRSASDAKTTRTDASGAFELPHLEADTYQLAVTSNTQANGKQRFGFDSRWVTIEGGKDVQLAITLDIRESNVGMPYGAPPARRRQV